MRLNSSTISAWLVGKGESDTLRTRLMGGLAGLLSLRVAFGAIAFALTVLLARLLGRDGLGTYSYALAWVTLLGAPAVLGMDQLMVREIPAFQLRSEWGLMHGAVRVAVTVVLVMAALMIGVTLAISLVLPAGAVAETRSTLWVALILVPLIALTRVRQGTLQGLHRVVIGAVPERLVLPAVLLAGLLLVRQLHVPLSAPGAMLLNAGATVIAFAVGTWLLRVHFPVQARQAIPEYRTALWIRGALPILLLNSVGVVLAQADVLLVGAIKGPGVVGLYGVADKSADLLSFVMLAQGGAFASSAASLYAASDLATLQRLITRIARVTLLPTLVLALAFIVFGGQFLTFFYGAQFGPAARALAILSVGQLVNVVAGLNGMLLIMTHHPGEAVKAVAVSALTNVVLNLLFISKWGMDGAALANTISLVVLNVLATSALVRKTGLDSSVFGFFGRSR